MNSIGIHTKSVAIIGGGISGLSCAKALGTLGIHSDVFDTGKNVPGGRCSSRTANFRGKEIIFDHSAQFITAKSAEFKHFCESNEELIEWNGPIGIIESGKFNEITMTDKRFVGVMGMRSLAELLSRGVSIRRPCWVSNIEKQGNGKWVLKNFNKQLGVYDAVVIAHNGKCADKLMSTSGVARIHELCRVSFGPSIPNPKVMRKMQLCSLWVMIFVLRKDSIASEKLFDAAYIMNSNILSWMANTSRKLSRTTADGDYESWTVISTREYAAANKVAQENVPPAKEAQVRGDMIGEFERCIGLPPDSVRPELTKLQLWGAAVPLNRHSAPCILDTSNGVVGICGDWFTPEADISGPSIESAWLSGRHLAHAIASGFSSGHPQDIGLDGRQSFELCGGHPLGDVPTTAAPQAKTVPPRGPTLTPTSTSIDRSIDGVKRSSDAGAPERQTEAVQQIDMQKGKTTAKAVSDSRAASGSEGEKKRHWHPKSKT